MKIEKALSQADTHFKRAERELAWGNFKAAAEYFERAAHYFGIVEHVAPWHLGEADMVHVSLNRRDLALTEAVT